MKTITRKSALGLIHSLLVSAGGSFAIFSFALMAPATHGVAAEEVAAANPLRVGITPEYPPLVFRQPDGTNGLEIDLAKALGQELQRPVEFVVVGLEEQIPALLDRRTDIIMTGMSITKARQLKIAFANPYIRNELRAIYRLQHADRYNSVEKLFKTRDKIGVIAGTTAEVFANRNCTNAEVIKVNLRRDVAYFLKSGRINVFLDDTFALAEIYANNEAEITFLKEPLNQESLAWGLRPGDTEFLDKVNLILARWKADGTLDRALKRWMPYLPKFTSTSPGT